MSAEEVKNLIETDLYIYCDRCEIRNKKVDLSLNDGRCAGCQKKLSLYGT